MSDTHRTVKFEPPPNMIYDLKRAARDERRLHRRQVWGAVLRAYLIIGSAAGIAALVLVLYGK